MTEEQPSPGPRFDPNVASIARIYDYWLGGKDNFQVDREAAEEMIQAFPGIVAGVRMNRAFLGRAIHYLAADAGIRQFLDIGTGLPSANNTHEVAQRAAPDSRIVYVDNDPSTRMGRTRAVPRSYPEVLRFFDGLEMVEPGLVQLHRWRPGAGVDTGKNLAAYGGVGLKP